MIGYNGSIVLRNDGLDILTSKIDLNAGIGVFVTVRLATVPSGSGAAASLFDINDAPIANPITSDNKGNYFFKVAAGTYDIITKEGTPDEVIEPSQAIGLTAELISDLSQAYEFSTVAAAVASAIAFPFGKILNIKEYSTGNGGGAQWVVKDSGTVTANNLDIWNTAGASIAIQLDVNGPPQLNEYGKEIKCTQIGMISDDNSTDYSSHLLRLMDIASNITVDGIFHLTNAIIPNKVINFKGETGHYGRFVAMTGGSIEYFIAPKTWVDDATSVNQPAHFHRISIDGGDKKRALVARWFSARMRDMQVFGGTEHALLVTSKGILGTETASTMVNNVFENVDVFGAADIGVEFTGLTNTDWTWRGGFAHNGNIINTTTNFKATNMAGAVVDGLHTYSGDINADFSGYGGGTTVANNYFEGPIVIGGGIPTAIMPFGPSNTVNGVVTLNYGSNPTIIKSFNNVLEQFNHNFVGSQIFYSDNDTITGATPLTFTNNANFNTAKMRISNAHFRDASFLDDTFSGFLSPEIGEIDADSLKNDRLGLPRSDNFGLVSGSTTISLDLHIDKIPASSGFVLEFDIGLRTGGGTGSIEIAANWRWSVLNVASVFTVTQLEFETSVGSWSSIPAPSFVVESDGTLTVTIGAIYTGTGTAIGNASMSAT